MSLYTCIGGPEYLCLPKTAEVDGLMLEAIELVQATYRWRWKLTVGNHVEVEPLTTFGLRNGAGTTPECAQMEFEANSESVRSRLRSLYERHRTDRIAGQVMRPVPDGERIVYAIVAPAVGRVKVGVTVDIAQRLGTLQGGSPVPLRLYGWMHGGYKVESAIHRQYARLRRHGEWFDDDGAILGYFDRNGEWR